MEKDKIINGVKCCAEFLCGECPYEKYDHPDYKLQCVHKLIKDIKKGIDEYEKSL